MRALSIESFTADAGLPSVRSTEPPSSRLASSVSGTATITPIEASVLAWSASRARARSLTPGQSLPIASSRQELGHGTSDPAETGDDDVANWLTSIYFSLGFDRIRIITARKMVADTTCCKRQQRRQQHRGACYNNHELSNFLGYHRILEGGDTDHNEGEFA